MQLKNKLVVTANEVRGFDEDLVKEWCGSDDISARGHYQGMQQFTGTFNLLMFTFQLDKMIKLVKDGGLERRIFAIKTLNKYEDVKDAEAAEALERRWSEEGETGMHAMYHGTPSREREGNHEGGAAAHAALHPDPPAGRVQVPPGRNRTPHCRPVGGCRSREPASGAHGAV
eukprot:1423673-Prymnesium_polylepis.1